MSVFGMVLVVLGHSCPGYGAALRNGGFACISLPFSIYSEAQP